MRVLFIQPEDPSSLVDFTRLARVEPLALESLGATIPDNEVKILGLPVDPNLRGPSRTSPRLRGGDGLYHQFAP